MSPEPEGRRRIARAVGVVGGATLLSRILGFLRDMIVAQFFGAGMATDAFFVAFRIPNLLRRLVGEGSLTASFIPVYSEYLARRSPEESDSLAHSTFTVLLLFLALLTLIGVLLSPWIIGAMAYGFSLEPEKFRLTVLLNRLMFPYLFFIGLVAWAMGVLNSHRHFAGPALAPMLLNISIIACALLLSRSLEPPVLALAFGVLIGGASQFLFQLPFLRHQGVQPRFRLCLSHPGLRRVGLLMAPSVLGLGVTQLNVLVNTFLASTLPEGSISYLYYADRLLEFPMGVFAIAIATAVLPGMSEQAARKDLEGLQGTLSFALRLAFFVTLPAMVGLIVLRVPILNLLFQRGAFTAQSTALTAQALVFYALGLVAFAGVRIITPAFYALQDTRTPVKVAFLALLANAGLGVFLMIPLQHGGLALATSLAAGLNFVLLVVFLRRRVGGIGGRKVFRSFLKSLVASAAMGAVVWFLCTGCSWTESGVTSRKLLFLGGGILTGLLVFGTVSYLLRSPEMGAFLRMFRRLLRSAEP